MCNPRRVRVQAKRRIAEAWRAEIEQTATVTDDVTAQATLVQPIAELLPPRAKAAFEQAMRLDPEWAPVDDGEYRHDVPGGHASYRTDTGELVIEIRLSVAIEEVATAKLVAAGEVTDEVTAQASGRYYDDGYAGHTKAEAERRARQTADAKAEQLAAERAEALKAEAREAAQYALRQRSGEAAAQARRTAQEKLTTRAEEVRSGLDQEAWDRLKDVQDETLKGVFQLVATGYSHALQQYAAEHGQNLQVSEEDGVIEIQFEVEG
jgi:hypothetical protein